jgi:hypothetical protein
VEGAQRMVEPCVYCTGVHEVSHGHLVYAPQPLEIGMGNDLKNQIIIDGDKAVNGIVDYFSECHNLIDWSLPDFVLVNNCEVVGKNDFFSGR